MKTDDFDIEVVVAGAGPVGLMVAGELAAHGVETVVMERLDQPAEDTRAQALHGRTVPTLDRRDLLAPFLAEHQERMARLTRGGPGRRPPTGHFAGITGLAWRDTNHDVPPALFVPQPATTRLLENWAREQGASVFRGATMTGFTQDEDGVTTHFAPGAPMRTLYSAYLIGCDGARSAVRKAAGIDFPGTAATSDTIAGEVLIADPEDIPQGWTRTPRGCTVISVRPGGHSRVVAIDFTGPAAVRDAPVTVAEMQATVSRILGQPVEMSDLRDPQRYGDAARQAERYREGRVFLVGDAAHIHYPVGGQGLNVGLQDAVNLAWKLAATIDGWAPASLLDTYSAERHPVAEAVLEQTRAQMALLNPDPRIDSLRSLFADLIRIPAVDEYLTSRIVASDVRYPAGDPQAHPLTGRFAPDLTLLGDDGPVRLAATLHPGRPVLLRLTEGAVPAEAAAGWSDRIDVHRLDCPDRPDLGALLLRPDGYVAWACSAGEPAGSGEGLVAAMRQWFGEPAHVKVG
ncbi:FAD-dependent monooxygenase [Actinoplanes sp. NPDC026619]|uniref:FAD-dependent monooxygenase n=1 Tax=Actinoplanes sp. NPDC026619 TaxID=3155798 RepID=UPI0033FAEECD